MTARTAAAFIAAVAACGGAARPARAPDLAGPAPALAPPAAAADPMSEAAILADARWLSDPRRGGRSDAADAGAVASWLERELAAVGLEVHTQDVADSGGQQNVVAIWRGSRAAPALLVVAHHDHIGRRDGVVHPGADDNASGVAAALAVARDLGRRRHLGRPVVFLFSAGEEIGLLGARAYAAAPAWPLTDTRAVINLDMVGRRFLELAVDRDAAVGVVGLGDDAAVAAATERAAAAVGVALVRASPALLLAVGQGWRGDDWALRRPGLPAIHLSTGLHDDYHQPTDTADRLVPAQMRRVARLVQGILVELDRESGSSQGSSQGRGR